MDSRYLLNATLAAVVSAALVVSGIAPFDRATWVMEVAPVLIALPILIATRQSYPLTTLLTVLIAAHALILIGGGAYTYARVPLGFWLQDVLGTVRNPYDKIGHLMQGFVPAMVTREILIRGGGARHGQGADEFLGTQGDQWDTQSDMFMALIGSSTAIALFSGWHDRQLTKLRVI